MIKLKMKRTVLYMALASMALVSCRDDEKVEQIKEVSIETQNSYDDQAIAKYLDTHYLDAKGNIKQLSETDTQNTKLSDLEPVKLPSGVVYIIRPNAQPASGTAIGATDVIHLMSNTMTYVATNTDDKIGFNSGSTFRNTIGGLGVPEVDPAYYYVKKSVLDKLNTTNNTTYTRSFYEIEGLQEALKNYQAFNMQDSDDYNLQGVIIVPSRAAFARDPHFNYSGISLRNRSFVFNFQVYKSRARLSTEN